MSGQTVNQIIDSILEYIESESLRERLRQPAELQIELLYALQNESNQIGVSRPSDALSIAERSQQLSHFIEHPMAVIFGLWIYAAALKRVERFQEYLEVNERIISLLKPIKDWTRIAGARVNQIGVLRELGETERALEAIGLAETACEQAGDEANKYLPNLKLSSANLFMQIGELETAFQHACEGYDRAHLSGDATSTFSSHFISLQGYLLLQMNRPDEAKQYLERALTIAVDINNDTHIAHCYLRFGYYHHQIGEYQTALQYFERSRATWVKIGVESEVAYLDYVRSTIYNELNMLDETLRLTTTARAVIDKHEIPWTQIRATIEASKALLALGQTEVAVGHLHDALELANKTGLEKLGMQVRYQLALAALEQQQWTDAIALAETVYAYALANASISFQAEAAVLRVRCALVVNDLTSAEFYLGEAQSLATQYNLRDIAIQVHYLQGRVIGTGDSQRAFQAFEQAVQKITIQNTNILLDEFRIGYLSDKSEIYQAYIAAAHQLVQLKELDASQLLHALNQTHTAPLSHNRLDTEGRLSAEEQAQLQALRVEWNWYQTKLDGNTAALLDEQNSGPQSANNNDIGTHQKLDDIEHAIAELLRRQRIRASEQVGTLKINGVLADEAALQSMVQAQLAPDEALIHFYVANENCHAVLVKADTLIKMADLAPLDKITTLLGTWRFHIQHVVPAQPTPMPQLTDLYLGQLYTFLFEPMMQHLQAVTRLNVILPTAWHDLPVAALYDGNQYLVESFVISHLSALDALLRRSVQAKPTLDSAETALIIGYSDGGRLPKTLHESFQVHDALPAQWHTTHLTEDDATADHFRQHCQRATLIHLATHGTFRTDNPLFSWLRFADKHITVTDMYDMQLKRQPLIVLSACETGQGKPRGGGVLGMGRGLLAAGASQVVLSRWQLEDAASAELMQHFYRILNPSQDNVAQALREAQIATLTNHPHPFFWASYMHTPG